MSAAARVLIVDDEPNVRLVFRTALESTGCTLSVAEDGEAALRYLVQVPFDLVLMDLRMPGLDGMQVLRRLREAGNDVPVVMITAHGSIPDAVLAMKLGAVDFLSKPLSPDALRAVVAEVLDRHAPTRSRPEPAAAAGPVRPAAQFAADLRRAKQALNRRAFGEAEVLLRQALALNDDSAEAHNLLRVLHELRQEHDASYLEYKAATRSDCHYEPARRNLDRFYERFRSGRSDRPIDTGGD